MKLRLDSLFRFNISLRDIVALVEEGNTGNLSTRVSEAVAEVQQGGMTRLSVAIKRIDSVMASFCGYGDDLNFCETEKFFHSLVGVTNR